MGISKQVVYLSGPMTGWPQFNREWFYRTEASFRRLGWLVLNPHRFWGEPLLMRLSSRLPRLAWVLAMIRDLSILGSAIVFCPRLAIFAHRQWGDSYGACIEITVAAKMGIPVIDEALH